MKMPTLRYTENRTRQQVVEFGGLNYGRTTKDGDLSETLNMSSRHYPAMSQRMGRKRVGAYENATAIYARDKLCVVDGTDFIYDGTVVGQVSEGEKQIVAVNSRIVIWPDKKVYNTERRTFEDMAVSVTMSGVEFTGAALSVEENPVEGKTLADLFAEGQGIHISGSSIAENNKSIIIRAANGNTLVFSDDSFTEGNSETSVTIERRIPDLKYICESANRLWGVDENTIWASALGDPLTFYNYDGISTDSYAVGVGTGGEFTGCIGYSSNVLFFKENTLHKMLGSEPSEYRIYDYTVPGVQEGCHKSMAIVNEVLYYKGESGVYAYTGGAPTLQSDNFGVRKFDSAAGGTDGQTYYISMRDAETGEWGLWSFDTLRAVWIREDASRGVDFARYNGDMCFLSGDGHIYAMGQDDTEEGRLPWEVTLAPFDWVVPERKQYTRLYIQAELEAGSYLRAEVREDSQPWRQVCVMHAERKKNIAVPIAPNRCDTLQVKLSGEGRCVIRQVMREYTIGGSR